MSDKTKKNIFSLIGVAGLILYGYLILKADISDENQKYTVIASALGVLYPLMSLTDNEFLNGNGWKAIGFGFLGTLTICLAGYGTKVDTEEGLAWDLFNAFSTEQFRMFYLVVLVIANIIPLVSKKYSVWVSSFAIGLMIPVIIVSLIALAILAIGLAILGALGKNNNSSNSWSSIFSNPSTSNYNESSTTVQNTQNTPRSIKQNNNRASIAIEKESVHDDIGSSWTHGRATFKGRQPSSGMLLGGVHVWYNGSLTQTALNGGVQIWEGTGNICVAYPRNYRGPKMEFYSSGGTVQIQVC
jgi:hypothetical protein